MAWLIEPAYLGKKMTKRTQAAVDALVSAGTARSLGGGWYIAKPPAAPLVPQNIVPPLISGEARVGQTLTSGAGVWLPTPVSYVYEWYSGPTALLHDSDQYIPVVGDIGNQITSEVVATNAVGNSIKVRGNAVGPVVAATADEQSGPQPAPPPPEPFPEPDPCDDDDDEDDEDEEDGETKTARKTPRKTRDTKTGKN